MAFVSNKKQFGLFILFLLLFSGYLALGALCFRYFESSYHAQVDTKVVELVTQFCAKYNCDEHDIMKLIFEVTGLSYGRRVEHSFNVSATRWKNFHETFFFSATIVTTIGYGDMVPQTNLGRWFCVLYACIGIPLTAVFVSHIGTIFMKLWKACFRFFTKYECKRQYRPRLNRFIRIFTALLLSLLTFTCLISLPAWGLTLLEGWTLNESYYFCFISLSTIGFGDYVIGGESERHRHQVVLRYVTIVYLITGLSVLTAVFKAIVEYNTKKLKKISFTAEKFIKRKAPKFSFNKEIRYQSKSSV